MLSELNIPLPLAYQQWTVYGAEWCPYCQKTKQYLEDKNIYFVYYDVDDYGKEFVKELLDPLTNNHKTIPTIFLFGKFIGGYTELLKILE